MKSMQYRKTHTIKEHTMIRNPVRADIPVVEPYTLPPSQIESGHILAIGIVLRVDRCAPEHGGGILVHVRGRLPVPITEDDGMVSVYGRITDSHLRRLRVLEEAATGIDYTKGIR